MTAAAAPAATGAQTPAPGTSTTPTYPAYRWILAWAVLLTLFWILSKNAIGYVAIYYGLLLILLFLFATNYQAFSYSLAPLQSLSGNAPPVTDTGPGQTGPR